MVFLMWILTFIIALFLIITYALRTVANNSKMKKQKKNSEECELTGHSWSGCICKRCGYENHKWRLTGSEPISSKNKKNSGGYISHYKCDKCGEEYTKENK